MDNQSFFDHFKPTDILSDPLPLKVLNHTIEETELSGQAIYWAFQYLYQKNCPSALLTPLLKRFVEVISTTDLSSCAIVRERRDFYEGENGVEAMQEISPSPTEILPISYQPLKLMQTVTGKIDEVCLEFKALQDNAQDVLDGGEGAKPNVYDISFISMKNTRRSLEDRMIILPNLDKIYNNQKLSAGYFAIFDGHNGVEAAAYAAAQLHQNLVASDDYLTDIHSAINSAFETTDSKFIEKCTAENIRSGTTAVLALIWESKIYVAWAGDSQAVLVKSTETVSLVSPHKPKREDEMQRIRDVGGDVILLSGTWRVNGNLAVSRAIGDYEYKKYIIATPEIKTIERDEQDEFLILACDGLWDDISPQRSAHIVRDFLAKKGRDLDGLGRALASEAKKEGCGDNITIIVVFLQPVETLIARYRTLLETESIVDLNVSSQADEDWSFQKIHSGVAATLVDNSSMETEKMDVSSNNIEIGSSGIKELDAVDFAPGMNLLDDSEQDLDKLMDAEVLSQPDDDWKFQTSYTDDAVAPVSPNYEMGFAKSDEAHLENEFLTGKDLIGSLAPMQLNENVGNILEDEGKLIETEILSQPDKDWTFQTEYSGEVPALSTNGVFASENHLHQSSPFENHLHQSSPFENHLHQSSSSENHLHQSSSENHLHQSSSSENTTDPNIIEHELHASLAEMNIFDRTDNLKQNIDKEADLNVFNQSGDHLNQNENPFGVPSPISANGVPEFNPNNPFYDNFELSMQPNLVAEEKLEFPIDIPKEINMDTSDDVPNQEILLDKLMDDILDDVSESKINADLLENMEKINIGALEEEGKKNSDSLDDAERKITAETVDIPEKVMEAEILENVGKKLSAELLQEVEKEMNIAISQEAEKKSAVEGFEGAEKTDQAEIVEEMEKKLSLEISKEMESQMNVEVLRQPDNAYAKLPKDVLSPTEGEPELKRVEEPIVVKSTKEDNVLQSVSESTVGNEVKTSKAATNEKIKLGVKSQDPKKPAATGSKPVSAPTAGTAATKRPVKSANSPTTKTTASAPATAAGTKTQTSAPARPATAKPAAPKPALTSPRVAAKTLPAAPKPAAPVATKSLVSSTSTSVKARLQEKKPAPVPGKTTEAVPKVRSTAAAPAPRPPAKTILKRDVTTDAAKKETKPVKVDATVVTKTVTHTRPVQPSTLKPKSAASSTGSAPKPKPSTATQPGAATAATASTRGAPVVMTSRVVTTTTKTIMKTTSSALPNDKKPAKVEPSKTAATTIKKTVAKSISETKKVAAPGTSNKLPATRPTAPKLAKDPKVPSKSPPGPKKVGRIAGATQVTENNGTAAKVATVEGGAQNGGAETQQSATENVTKAAAPLPNGKECATEQKGGVENLIDYGASPAEEDQHVVTNGTKELDDKVRETNVTVKLEEF